MIVSQDLNLAVVGGDANVFHRVVGFDAISIEAKMLQGSFGSGVITLKKSNCNRSSTLEDLNATPVTIAATGTKDLLFADFGKAQYIVATVTTANAGARVQLIFSMKTLGFNLT